MTGFAFRKHATFEWLGVPFRIREYAGENEFLLEALQTGALKVVPREDLLKGYSTGDVKAMGNDSVPMNVPSDPIQRRPLADIPEARLSLARRRYAYLQALYELGDLVFTPNQLQPRIMEVAHKLDDASPPSPSTIYRWHKQYTRAKDIRALIPRFDRRGSKKSRAGDAVLILVEEAVTEAFRASPLATVPAINTRVLAKIARENQGRIPGDQLKPPSLRSLYRLVAKASAYEMYALKRGKGAADRKFRIVKSGVQTSRILERVESDHTPLDLFLIDDQTSLPLGRPTLTVLIDHFSRMLLGYYLSFGPPSANAVMKALRHAIDHKVLTQDALPKMKIVGTWPCYGMPEALVVDNGLEFLGSTLESVCMDLRIRIEFCPARQPRFKGVVERYLKTVNHYFAHQLPGASFARFHQRGDHDPTKQAVLTLAEFKQLFEKWVVDVYSQTVHRGLGTTPLKRWQEGMLNNEPELPPDRQMLMSRIGEVTERQLRPNGIELHGNRYNCDELAHVIRAYGVGVKVRVVYDSEDLGEIQVWAPDAVDPVTVPALDMAYAKGLTQRQNALVRELARDSANGACDKGALQQARAEIVREVEALAASRKQKERQRSAAIRGISSTKPDAVLPPAEPVSSRPQPTPVNKLIKGAGTELPPLTAFRIPRSRK